MGTRVLITGLDTFWGGRVAQALETDRNVELVLGLGTSEPSVPLERTEYVHADATYSILSRIVRATQVDTILHTSLVTDSGQAPVKLVHEKNVIATANLLAAACQPSSSVNHVIVKSSTLVYGSHASDPAWFSETTPRNDQVRTRIEKSLLDVEGSVSDFAHENPDISVSLLRFANVLGTDIVTSLSSNLARRMVPSVAGFDPMVQFVEEDDVVRSLEHVTRNRLPGTFNVAGDGKLTWSEVCHLAGASRVRLPPSGTLAAGRTFNRLGIIHFPSEMESLLRYGRGVDTTAIKATGFNFKYSTAGAVRNFVKATRLRRTLGRSAPIYTFDQDLELFFRRSPAVVRSD